MNLDSLSYKGYLGTVNFSEKDACFYGKIEGIDGLVNFEGESVQELTESFHEAVDDYVSFCVNVSDKERLNSPYNQDFVNKIRKSEMSQKQVVNVNQLWN